MDLWILLYWGWGITLGPLLERLGPNLYGEVLLVLTSWDPWLHQAHDRLTYGNFWGTDPHHRRDDKCWCLRSVWRPFLGRAIGMQSVTYHLSQVATAVASFFDRVRGLQPATEYLTGGFCGRAQGTGPAATVKADTRS